MSALADLFSEGSPPPTSPPRRSPSPATPPRHRSSSNPLFFSPGDTPHRPTPGGRPRSPIFSPPPDQQIDYGEAVDERGDLAIGGVFDPLDLSGMFAAEAGESNQAGIDDDNGGKKRRVMAKVDPERLTGSNGIPALMRAAKRFKPRGKGHEEKDLKDVLTLYQIWAHGMFPKGDFEGTIKRVETVCRTRRMEIAMKGFREAFYPPPPRSPSPPGLSPLHSSPPLTHTQELHDPTDNTHLQSAERSLEERRSSEPLFDRQDMDDGPDFDELLAMEEMERDAEQAQASVRTQDRSTHQARDGTGVDRHDEKASGDQPLMPEEEEWEGLYD